MCVRQGYKSDVVRVSREGGGGSPDSGETDQEEPPELDDDEAGGRGGGMGARVGEEEGGQCVLFLGGRGESVREDNGVDAGNLTLGGKGGSYAVGATVEKRVRRGAEDNSGATR